MLATGDLLHNRYRIEELLGEGGMGAVYRASDETLGVTVAVKENQVVTAAAQRQFEREARLLAGLRHPGLPRVSDHFIVPNQGQYLVMDYIEGEDLSRRLARLGRLPEAEVIALARDVLDALAYLHSRGIIHRDIKPANIKIAPNGQAILVDFGIAKMTGAGQTTTGARGLTPGYAPPEQYGFGSTDPRSDLYSFGATLYHSLTGQVPADAFARMVQGVALVPVRYTTPEINYKTAQVIETALAVKADDRWSTAEEMRQAIEPETKRAGGRGADLPTVMPADAYATQVEVAPPPPPTPAPDAHLPTPQAPVPPLGGGTHAPARSAGVRGGAGVIPPPVFAQSPPAVPGTAPRHVTTPRPARRLWIGAGLVGLVGLGGLGVIVVVLAVMFGPGLLRGAGGGASGGEAAASGHIAFVSNRNGNYEIYRVEVDGSGLLNLTNAAADDYEPAFSPDGSKIAFVSDRDGNPDIYLMDADGTGVINLTNNPAEDRFPAWSPDGSTLLFASDRDGNFEIYASNQDGVVRYTNADGNNLYPSLSSDGTLLAFSSDREGNFEIYMIGPDGLQRYTDNAAFDGSPRWSPSANVLAFESDRDGNHEVYLFGENGLERYTNDELANDGLPAWSPDGGRLAFVSDRDGDNEIYILGPEGVTQVTDDPEEDTMPTWGP